MSEKCRPAQDISLPLSGGPTACEAALMFGSWNACRTGVSPRATRTRAVGSPAMLAAPNGSTALKVWLARPSQKLRRMNTALIALGVLRGSTRRVSPAPVWKMPSGGLAQLSAAAPAAAEVNGPLNAPAEEVTSSVPQSTVELRLA